MLIWGYKKMSKKNILTLDNLSISYGGIKAVKGVSLCVPEGEIVTLIGANGAGKSTILRTIAGLVRPESGTVHFYEENITGSLSNGIVEKGITLVPEGRHVFPNLTVLENLKIGGYLRKDKLEDDINRIYKMFPRLEERSWQMSGTLSGGEQQMLAVGRALMSKPKVIMMDEPSLGLAPLIVNDIMSIIKTVNSEGMTILLVEQNANLALKIAHLGYVMETGQVTLQGTGAELLNDDSVKAAYLGKTKKK